MQSFETLCTTNAEKRFAVQIVLCHLVKDSTLNNPVLVERHYVPEGKEDSIECYYSGLAWHLERRD